MAPKRKARGDLVNAAEAARRLGTSEKHVRRMAGDGRLTYTKVGGRLLFDTARLDEWLDEHTVEAVR